MARRDPLRWLTARPIAHRGLHDLALGRPENSLAAFHAAVDARYAIECDVHLSSDGVPVVFHDDSLERLTSAFGPVRDRTAAQLTNIQLSGTEERIPTLEEVLWQVSGRVPLIIEMKHVRRRDAGLAAAVADELKRYHGPAAVMSFDPRLIEDMRAAAPSLPRGLVAEGGLLSTLRHVRAALRLKVDFVSYRIDDLPCPATFVMRSVLNIPLISWTVRTRHQAERARAWADQITFEGFRP